MMFSLLPLAALIAPLALACPVQTATSASSAAVTATSTVVSSSASSTASTPLTCTTLTTAPFSNTTTAENLYALSQSATEGGRVITQFKVILGNENGTIEACYGDEADGCKSEVFGFETCSVQDQYTSYGHITYTNSSNATQCLGASSTPFGNSSLVLQDCEYDLETATAAGQYWLFQYESNASYAVIYGGSESNIYGPTADIENNATLTLASTLLDGTQSTWFTFSGVTA